MRLHRREFTLRATGEEAAREVTGLAVPYDDEIELVPGLFESVAPGAPRPPARGRTGVKLLWRHDEPIGVVTSTQEEEAGLRVTARISPTPRGEEAYQLLRDGVIDRFSIGFLPVSSEETTDEAGHVHVRHTQIDLYEVSLVPWPAYEAAAVTDVRHDPHHTDTEEHTMDPAKEITALRTDLADLAQQIDFLRADTHPTTPAADQRTAGAFLKALAAGDQPTTRAYEAALARAWEGTTTAADATTPTPAWIGDLTRLYTEADRLAPLFSTGALPAEGMSLEFTELDANTVKVDVQEHEGDTLPLGKVTTRDRTTPIQTFGGYTTLSRQAIERTRVNLLDHHLRAMTLAAAARAATYFATAYATAVKARAATAITTTKAPGALTWADLAGIVIEAATAYDSLALTLDGLIVDKDTFKALASLTAADGRPLMSVSGTGANTAGTMSLPGLAGALVGVTVTPNLRQKPGDLGAGVVGAFYNKAALRTYQTPLVQLQAENVTNLTRDFSVYRYAAVATEIPAALVPLKAGA